jgi:hypothetical protein
VELQTPIRGVDVEGNQDIDLTLPDAGLHGPRLLNIKLLRRSIMEQLKRAGVNSILSIIFVLATAVSAAALEVGEKAPDFELNSTKGGKLKLSSLKGKNVLINFYVLDFNPT